MNTPVLSVIIPCHNHARFLGDRIRSVQAQTMPDFEAIFLDDGSSDNSFETAQELAGTDPRFRFLRSETPTGNPFAAWRRGLAEARGDIVWLAESDDACEPGFLAALLPRLLGDPGMGMAYCQSLEVDTQGRTIRHLSAHTDVVDYFRWRMDYVAEGMEECRRALLHCNTIPNVSACMFRAQALAPALAATAGYMLCGDWAAYAALLLQGWRIGYCAAAYNRYRNHATSQRNRLVAQGTEILETVAIKRQLKRLLAPSPGEVALSSVLTLRRLTDLAAHCEPREVGRWFEDGSLLTALTDFDPHFLDMLAGASANRRIQLEIFPESGGTFREEGKMSLSYGPNIPWTFTLEVPAGRLRIDPSCAPGLLRIHSLAVFDDGNRLLRTYSGDVFREIEVAGTCFPIVYDVQGMLLYAYGPDPILLLPHFGRPGRHLRLELTLTGYSLIHE